MFKMLASDDNSSGSKDGDNPPFVPVCSHCNRQYTKVQRFPTTMHCGDSICNLCSQANQNGCIIHCLACDKVNLVTDGFLKKDIVFLELLERFNLLGEDDEGFVSPRQFYPAIRPIAEMTLLAIDLIKFTTVEQEVSRFLMKLPINFENIVRYCRPRVNPGNCARLKTMCLESYKIAVKRFIQILKFRKYGFDGNGNIVLNYERSLFLAMNANTAQLVHVYNHCHSN